MQAAQLRGEVILGVQLHAEQKNKDKMFGIALIPDKNDEFTLSKEDGLIALAEDES
jgi:plastocyanin domain-containing protein